MFETIQKKQKTKKKYFYDAPWTTQTMQQKPKSEMKSYDVAFVWWGTRLGLFSFEKWQLWKDNTMDDITKVEYWEDIHHFL